MSDGLEQKVSEHERRISKLENYRENDFEKISKISTDLATIIVKLENITKTMDTLSRNWEEAIEKSNLRQQETDNSIKIKITSLENSIEVLEKELTNRTIGKNSDMLDKIKWIIISVFITAIATYMISKFIP